MKQIVKRGLALLMTVVMCLSLIPALAAPASAAGTYTYNWGTRGTVATSLSQNAESFYSETTYAELSELSGGTGVDNAPASELYAALQDLMADNHSTITSYDDIKGLCQYTDCQNGGGSISSFYSGNPIGPAWDSGSTWNREHTWPNSKSTSGSKNQTNRETDIMMLRPTAATENSSRGNKAYGESVGFYDPNSVSNGALNLHGDVARIVLYVYTRWGNTADADGVLDYMWGSDGVIESLDVLIKWMAEDPVDTWEMGRNDSVESITGTRNVFVDYPELAFLLFGEDIPNTLTTPSGEAKNHQNCDHQYQAGTPVAATCTAKGYTPYTCSLCGKVFKDNYTDMIDHTYVDGTCSVCGATEDPYYVTEPVAGTAYKLGLYSTNKSKEYYFKGTMSNYYGATSTTYDEGVDVYLEETTGGYYLYFTDSSNTKQYIKLVQSGTYYNFTYTTSAGSVFTWDADKDALHTTVGTEDCYMGTYGNYVTMGVLRLSKMKDTDYIARLYTMGSSSGEGGETPCEHSWNDATCAAPKTCKLCGATEGEKTDEHNYVNGACSVCGQADPNAGGSGEPTTATITFDDKAKRTEFTTSKQVWQENGITVTNNKGASTSNVADYANPARFYKSSQLIIEYPGMTKIEVTCNNSSYATALKNSITTGTVTVSGKVVTITLSEASDSYTIASLSGGQVRVDSITVYAEASQPSCDHQWSDATCTAPKTCSKCGETEGEALGHSWNDATCKDPKTCGTCGATEGEKTDEHNYVSGTCSVCGQADPNAGGSGEPTTATITFDDKAKRTEYSSSKQVWTENGITVTNNKGASTSNVADYAKPARFYAGSELVIEYPGLNKVVFTCSSSSYATALKNSIPASSGTVTVSGSVVTLTLTNAADTFTIAKLSAQVRMNSITVYGSVSQPSCQHDWQDATCTAPKTCSKCGETEGEALGHSWNDATCKDPKTCGTCGATEGEKTDVHNYVDGTCSVCGAADPNASISVPTTATITFDDKAKRTEFTTSKQVWTENGITVTNNKAASSNNVADYAKPARFYAGSNLVLEYPGLNKVVFTCSSSSYATALKNSIPASSGTVTVSGSVVTLTLTNAADTFTIAKLSAQVRMNSITVYGSVSQPSCQHDWQDATCTAPKTCTKCGETEGEALGHSWNDATCAAPKTCGTCGATEGEALSHSWNDATCEAPKTCSACGATDGNALGHTYAKSMTTAPTCTSAGIAVYTCTRCGGTSASAIPAAGHVWVNGICSVCGEKNQSSEGMNSAQLCGGGKDCILHAFSDINVGAWYHDGVHYCVEHALFQGLPGGKFGPTETTTRAQLITILWRLEGSPVVNYLMDFDDVESDQWYTEAVRWAAAEKIVGGYGNGLFGINDAITREQMATILWRYAQYKKQDVSVGENTNILSYGDVAQVNEYAIPAMQWACGAGLIQGIAADNTMNLDPAGSANRAQVATILYRYCEKPAK